MDKNETKKQTDKDTLAEVTKEMAKPRVAMSARIAHEAKDRHPIKAEPIV